MDTSRTKRTESPKDIRDAAAERIASLINHGMTDAEISQQIMFEVDPITLIGVIRDQMSARSGE